jgi:hypothetical protein
MFRDCCGLAEVPAGRALIASIVVDLGFIAAAIAAARGRLAPSRRALGITAALGISLAIGVAMVNGMTYAPVVPRETTALQCTSGQDVTVCLWPEDLGDRAAIVGLIAEVRASWLALGVPAPSTFTEAIGAQGDGVDVLRVPQPVTRDRMILALATGLTPPTVECAVISAESVPGFYLLGWFAAAGGLSAESLAQMDVPSDGTNKSLVETVHDLREATPSARAAWMARAVTGTRICTDTPVDLRVTP